jgi:hypothetical protein
MGYVNTPIRPLHRPTCLRIHAAFFVNPFLNTRINAHAADDSFRSLSPSGTGNRKAPGEWKALSLACPFGHCPNAQCRTNRIDNVWKRRPHRQIGCREALLCGVGVKNLCLCTSTLLQHLQPFGNAKQAVRRVHLQAVAKAPLGGCVQRPVNGRMSCAREFLQRLGRRCFR